MRVAVDAMGGDNAPREVVKGVVLALQRDEDLEVILVGNQERIQESLRACEGPKDRVVVDPVEGVVRADEDPLLALRRKEETSVGRAVTLLKTKEADAMLSAGNTGATVAAAVFTLKFLEGVHRAGIATFIPTVHGRAVVIDVGANLRCRPEHLFQYGVMGSVFSRLMLERRNPSIGLLNIGQEDKKGTELVRETRDLFAGADINFRGNMEGQEVFMGEADVFVCEGFVGNVVLKISEGLAEAIMWMLGRQYAKEETRNAEERQNILKSLEWIRQRTDYREYGGAPLLGVDGACIIGHGRSDARAVANGIWAAARFAGLRVNEHMVDELQRLASPKC